MDEPDYEKIVAAHHENLYRFALSLSGTPHDAAELTQETYVRLLNKSAQLRDARKVKSWLFTTLYRIFLGWKRHETRFPHIEVYQAEKDLPTLTTNVIAEIDAETVMDCVGELHEHFRVPLTLFYLQALSYREIAEVLRVPIGTVMSRLARGKELLRERLCLTAVKARRDAGERRVGENTTLKLYE